MSARHGSRAQLKTPKQNPKALKPCKLRRLVFSSPRALKWRVFHFSRKFSLMTEQALHFHAPAKAAPASTGTGRWSVAQIEELFALPFPELIARAGQVHREHFNPAQVELATLLSIKTGGCPENCSYCPQSVHYDTGVEASKLMETAEVQKAAKLAKEAGAQRFCMGTA